MTWHSPVELELRLDGLPHDDVLCLELSPDRASLTVGEMLLGAVHSEEARPFTEVELRDNPDLPDLFDQFADIFERWTEGVATLRFHRPGGEQIDPGAPVRDVLAGRRLSLVVRQTFEVLEWFAAHGGERADLVGWLRRSALLYAIDKHDLAVLNEPGSPLQTVALELRAEGVLEADETGRFRIAGSGRERLGAVLAETEAYIDQYDIFCDVLYDLETRSVRFGTGNGEDLRVQVYESEGIDPIRAVFLLRLYDASLDGHPAGWTEKIVSDEVFDWMLSPVLDRSLLREGDLEWMIEAGFAENEERVEEARRNEARRRALSRAHAAD